MAWLHTFEFSEHDLPFLHADATGGIFYADTFELPDTTEAEGSAPAAPATTLSASEVFGLHSKPGATNIIYLDFDGHLISGTVWSNSDLNAVSYDLDGITSAFNQAEIDNIAEIWRRIAEDFAPFTVDITTEEPTSFGPTVGRLLITRDTDANGQAMPAQGAGGVAYVNVWGISSYSNYYSPALVYYNNLGGGRADFVSEATSHEAGHNLALSHDATGSSSYYGGHGSGAISWGPIMGTGYYRNVSQWSKGEYADANNQQDDLAILDTKLGYRGDDHADITASASRIVFDASGNVAATTPANDPDNLITDNKGIIESANDLDVFYFDTPGGNIDLVVTPAWQDRNTRGANLDILATLYDVNGTFLLQSDDLLDTDSQLTASLTAGRYYVTVEGAGNTQSPYTDYGSIGRYFITGTIPASNDISAPNPDPMTWQAPPQATGRDSIGMTATVAIDDSGIVEYYFECTSGCAASGWQSDNNYTASGLLANTAYEYRVRTRDASLNETGYSLPASATTLQNQSPSAQDDIGATDQETAIVINVLANDSDPENDALMITAVSQGSNDLITNNGNTITFTPDPGFTGSDSFSYTISDSFGALATANVTVTVTAVNQPPLAVADSKSINKGDTVIIDVLANDVDPEGDPLTITGVTSANKGTVSWQADDRTITYSHNPKRKGSDNFSYTISDGNGGLATATVSISLGGSGGDTGTGGGGNGKGKKK